jgi:hypothetical protein
MTPAAAEYKSNIGHDFTLADADYLDTNAAEVEDVDLMSVEQRQALNLRMAEKSIDF